MVPLALGFAALLFLLVVFIVGFDQLRRAFDWRLAAVVVGLLAYAGLVGFAYVRLSPSLSEEMSRLTVGAAFFLPIIAVVVGLVLFSGRRPKPKESRRH